MLLAIWHACCSGTAGRFVMIIGSIFGERRKWAGLDIIRIHRVPTLNWLLASWLALSLLLAG
jgi:hypothetical protein